MPPAPSTSAIICSCLLLPLAVPVYLCQHLYLSTSSVICALYLSTSAVVCICLMYLCCRLYLSNSAVFCTCRALLSSVPVQLCCGLYLSSSAVVCTCLQQLCCGLFLSTFVVVCTCLPLLSSVLAYLCYHLFLSTSAAMLGLLFADSIKNLFYAGKNVGRLFVQSSYVFNISSVGNKPNRRKMPINGQYPANLKSPGKTVKKGTKPNQV